MARQKISVSSLPEDRAGPVLDWLQRLLQDPGLMESQPMTFLQDCREAFAAQGVGLVLETSAGNYRSHLENWEAGQKPPGLNYPWEPGPNGLTNEVENNPGDTAQRHWILSPTRTNTFPSGPLWVYSEKPRNWSTGDVGALSLAHQVLVNLVSQATITSPWGHRQAHWRRRQNLDQAAQVSGRLAHDLGNILTGLLGFSELALQQIPPGGPGYRYLHEVYQAAQQGTSWVRKLQWLSRRAAASFSPTNLADVLMEEKARIEPSWAAAVALRSHVPPDLPLLAIESEALRQALGQLLDNGREAISNQGTVTVRANSYHLEPKECPDFHHLPAGLYVEIMITDTGYGIGPDRQARINKELFYSTKPRHRGLGLAVIHGIARTYKGGFAFGPHPQQGTTVRLLFPAAPHTEPTNPILRSNTRRAGSILVVDDDPSVLAMAGQVLRDAGYQVATAATGEEALALFTAPGVNWSLVVSDILMPDLSGLQLAKLMLERDPEANFLFISSQSSFQKMDHDLLIKNFPLLAKPFDTPHLLRCVRQALLRPSSSPP